MVTDNQVRKLMKHLQQEKTLGVAAAKAGMDEKTARKYRDLERLPSEIQAQNRRTWRTRDDPFAENWPEIRMFLDNNPGLEAKTLFEYLQRQYPGRFPDGQLRTLQRKVKNWRAQDGPAREVYFPQVHTPGRLSQSDFTHMGSLGITIGGKPFDHLIYHFVLTFSNWETGTICFSESFESLSQGLQNALWTLGGVPQQHQTDRLSTAVQKTGSATEFTARYEGLLAHYGLTGRTTQAASPHENGDVEQSHYRFKKAVDQALMLRGSRDFARRTDYDLFLQTLFKQRNANRQAALQQELATLRALPTSRLAACTRFDVRVGPSSTIRIKHKVYSVHSRLIGEQVTVRLYAETLDVWHGQRRVETLPRLRGSRNHHIQYRHIIDWLVRKPGALANYRYHSDLFPTSRFRLAHDALQQEHRSNKADREYLQILELAARENELAVDQALEELLDQERPLSSQAVKEHIKAGGQPLPVTDLEIPTVALGAYDRLLTSREVRV